VDYLKDKGIEQTKHKNSDDVYNVLCGQFAGDRGKKKLLKKEEEKKKKKKLYV
jgi:translation initiation factor IF-2